MSAPPKRPLSAYFLFCQEKRADFKELTPKQQSVKFGELWRETNEEGRATYKKKEEEAKAAYQDALKTYKEANPEYVPIRRRHKKRVPKTSQTEAPEKSLLDE